MIEERIESGNKYYPTSKYLLFIRDMIAAGWKVKIYEVQVSKYVFVYKDDVIYKVRFSNHKPIYHREVQNDCDFYAGVSHKNCLTTEQIKNKILGAL